MAGRHPSARVVCASDRRSLELLLRDGRLAQRVANRARALLALARGESLVVIGQWTGLSRMGLWHLWDRYTTRGVAAVFDAERSGRPSTFSPSPARRD